MLRTKNHTRKVGSTAKGLMKYKITWKYFLLHLMTLDPFLTPYEAKLGLLTPPRHVQNTKPHKKSWVNCKGLEK